MIDLETMTNRLERNAATIQRLVAGVSAGQARWKPAPEAWSMLEVINHLYDEEREDFRARLDFILHPSDDRWPAIDPEGWVAQRRYNERDLAGSVQNFLDEREKSLAWLKALPASNWQADYQTQFGPITAGDMFAAWVAHDILHMRQLVELHWAYTTFTLQSYRLDYAGPW